ncbi:hypothetical protein RvY_10793 [Ramazzottius varieornatus]|uniref:Protein kinase domain-containing protein n=1 Tax=Ramazzottius varieornatus TaxID=947166 RepID=A0A1D1VLR8_RAMVA|nr:hypothetical protein RvY_10793 [Ramazzottius varieornatus]
MIVNMWMPPEVRQDPRKSLTAESDVLSFGLSLYDMSTWNTSFDVNLNDMEASTGWEASP